MRALLIDFDDAPATAHSATNCDPFQRPDQRGKKHTRPMGRVVHKRKPRRAKVVWVEVGE